MQNLNRPLGLLDLGLLVYYCQFHFQLFVELNELITDKDEEMRWKERARWIKFEEDVEEETDRWGKPHVASLSFRSLLELRRTITQGKREIPTNSQLRGCYLFIFFWDIETDVLPFMLFPRCHPPGPGAKHHAWYRQRGGGDADNNGSDSSGGQS